ncbi:MAG: signal transduction histidine kinase [Flaviaesturariibacter sp.]|nr:signal transduction histidine kinase [Flaviaesturariibacter sp.]
MRPQPKQLLLFACLLFFATARGRSPGFSLYEDKSKTVTAAQALDLFQHGAFTPVTDGKQNIGFTHSLFWVAFRQDRLPPRDSLVLNIGDHHINIIRVYVRNAAGLTLLHTSGDYQPFNTRPLPTTNFYFPVRDTGIYLVQVDKSNESLQLSFGLHDYVSVLRTEAKNTSVMGFLTGIICLLLLFGLYLFVLTRDRVYLFYVLYICSGWMWVLGNSGHGFEYLWPNSPWFASKARPVFSTTTVALSFNFMLHYIGAANQRILRRVVLGLSLVMWSLAVAILFFTNKEYHSSIWYIVQAAVPVIVLVYIVFMIAILAVRSWQGNRLAQFYLVAIMSLLAVIIMQLAFYTGKWKGEESFFRFFGVALGYISEAIILTAGLAYRFNEYRREKEQILVELNRRQVENTRTLIEVQEAERSQIANQLHDVAGSLLSAARLNLSALLEKAYKEQQPVDLRLQKTEEAITQVAETVRNLSHALSPVMLTQVGIRKALEKIVDIFNASGKIHVTLIVSGFEDHQESFHAYYTGLYGLIYELLNNIIKHAGATHALVQVAEMDECFTIIVEDNGIGIDPAQASKPGSLGLTGVLSKITYFGGQMAIDRAEPTGTLITIEIPRIQHAL